MVNDRACHEYGYSREEFLEMEIFDIETHGPVREEVRQLYDSTAIGQVLKVEGVNKRKDGTTFPVEVRFTKIDAEFALANVRDVSERMYAENEIRESHQQLQRLAARQNAVREEERVQIARAIHDRLGQELTVLKLDLSWVKSKLRKDQTALKEKARDLGELANTMIQTVREITHQLRPPLLDDLGLVAAIEWELDETHKHSGVQCVLQVEPEEIILETDLSISLFRIFQEALANVTRHAQATHIDFSLKLDPESVVMVIEDDGIGITPAQLADEKSYGLIGIRERATQFGGKVQITQPERGGTRVHVDIPLVERKHQDD